MIRHVQNKTHVHVDVRVINKNNLGTTGEQPGNNGGIMACDTRGKKMQNTAVTAESLAH